MRLTRILAAAAIFIAIGPGPLARPLLPPAKLTLAASASPVVLDPANPERRRFGSLELVEAWHIASPHDGFGGWSALAMTGDRRFIAASDSGWIGRFTLGKSGQVSDLSIATLPGAIGRLDLPKYYRDIEALARAENGDWLASNEGGREIRRYTPRFEQDIGVARPREMHRWPSNAGAEAMTRLADGRWLIVAEGGRLRPGHSELLVFDRAPDRADARVERHDYESQGKGAVADALTLADGRVLLLHRRFSLLHGFTTTIAVADPDTIGTDAAWTSRTLGVLAAPLLVDNFEGMAIDPDPACNCVWIISDDNQAVWQRTLLLRIRLPR